MIFRRPFADLIRRQLDLFERDHAELIAACAAAERAYDDAPAGEAEERYGAYVELCEEGVEALAEIRDSFERTLEPTAAEAYEAAFDRVVRKRLPRFALGHDLA